MYEQTTRSIKKDVNKGKGKALKKDQLRYNEYYNMQPVFDNLYKQSESGSSFKNLYNLISSDENILLAYRNIKNNHGSDTSGTNRHTIQHLAEMSTSDFLKYFKTRLSNFQPMSVRRVEIPKPNGKTRPLGIPCIEDRIIQQCIKQVLEPIVEAKFHQHSYGFRPNRSTAHAIAYTYKKINREHCYFVVDVDIKGFFDNVNHAKLLKQLWAIGIRDKKVLCIIGKMLKAEIEGEGIPNKGVPQGGILSPLLANVVLNELDWWISNQWETYNTEKEWTNSSNKYRHLRKSHLKEMYIVRYADDFKIFCKDFKTANKMFHSTKQWLKDRLQLDISPDKSKITNIQQRASEFLGFRIKAKTKGKTKVVESHLTEKAKESIRLSIKEQVKNIRKFPIPKSVDILNSIIAGVQNYYEIATHVIKDFGEIDYKLRHYLKTRLKEVKTKGGEKSADYINRYYRYKGETKFVCNTAVYPISHVNMKIPYIHKQSIHNYNKVARQEIHKDLDPEMKWVFKYLSKHPMMEESVEMNDNRLSLYSAQQGKCRITGLPLKLDMKVHRITPIEKKGTDKYNNLMLVTPEIYDIINIKNPKEVYGLFETNMNYFRNLSRINKFRSLSGNKILI